MTTSTDKELDLARWIIDFEFNDPANRHMSQMQLAEIYAAKIQAHTQSQLKQFAEEIRVEVIGDDEPVTTKIGKGSVSRGTVVFTNRLRAIQRQSLDKLLKRKGLL